MPFTSGHLLPACLIMCLMNTAAAAGPPDRLPLCPDTPNCVSSQAVDAEHAIEPIAFSGPAAEAMQRLVTVLDELPRSKAVTRSDSYLHYEFRSLLFRFVDDVECLLDADNGVIHIRSASRVGRSDLGVNRKRVERIRAGYMQP